jgi:hypothetical protein
MMHGNAPILTSAIPPPNHNTFSSAYKGAARCGISSLMCGPWSGWQAVQAADLDHAALRRSPARVAARDFLGGRNDGPDDVGVAGAAADLAAELIADGLRVGGR